VGREKGYKMREYSGDGLENKIRDMYPEGDLDLLQGINQAVNEVDPTAHMRDDDPTEAIYQDILTANPETRKIIVNQISTLAMDGNINAGERAHYQEALKKYQEAIDSGLIPPSEDK